MSGIAIMCLTLEIIAPIVILIVYGRIKIARGQTQSSAWMTSLLSLHRPSSTNPTPHPAFSCVTFRYRNVPICVSKSRSAKSFITSRHISLSRCLLLDFCRRSLAASASNSHSRNASGIAISTRSPSEKSDSPSSC